jgi:hypothetical protein
MRFFQPVMLVCAVAMSFVGALGLPGCARAIGECLNDKHKMALGKSLRFSATNSVIPDKRVARRSGTDA